MDGLGEVHVVSHPVAVAPDVDHGPLAIVESLEIDRNVVEDKESENEEP